jgi:hypothetical protein
MCFSLRGNFLGVLRWFLALVFVALLNNISLSQDNPKRNWKLEINGTVQQNKVEN